MLKREVGGGRYTLMAVLTIGLSATAHAADPSGRELVASVEQLLWGDINQGRAEMTVTTPRWERKLELRFRMDRPERRPASDRCASRRKCGIT